MTAEPATTVRIICQQHSLDSSYWCAWNEDAPFRRSSADHPASAVRRYLETNYDHAVAFELACDHDLVGNGTHCFRGHWRPPDLFLQCDECHGSGTYVGFLSVQRCQACTGQGEFRVLG